MNTRGQYPLLAAAIYLALHPSHGSECHRPDMEVATCAIPSPWLADEHEQHSVEPLKEPTTAVQPPISDFPPGKQLFAMPQQRDYAHVAYRQPVMMRNAALLDAIEREGK